MIIVRVKYSRQAIPYEYEFDSEKARDEFIEMKSNNPYVRWIEKDVSHQYSKEYWEKP